MRKTFIAMLGLAAICVWALPAFADYSGDPPPVTRVRPLDERANGGNYTATLSGTVINQSSVETTVWYLYPGACQQRALGTWAPSSTIIADSLNGYATGTTGGYTPVDLSLKESLWHVVNSGVTPSQRPAILNGTASLWCGKYDPTFINTVGYPNRTFQILYVDTGSHASGVAWDLSFKMNQATEIGYDYVYLIGGDPAGTDAMGNLRAKFDEATSSGASGDSHLLVQWTASIKASPSTTSINVNNAAPVVIEGDGSSQPDVFVPVTVHFPAVAGHNYRDIYILFTADCGWSSQDGLWPFGHGVIWDDLATSDNGPIFTDGTAPSGSDPFGGFPLQGSYGNQGYIAARVAPGAGELWQIVDGSFASTADNCALVKNDPADHFFFGVDASSKKTIPGMDNSVVTCTFPVPTGSASVFAIWDEYLDLPRGSGYAQETEYRYYKSGSWSDWQNSSAGGGVFTSTIKTWVRTGAELAAATQADSVQVRYDLHCIPPFATDGTTCGLVDYAIMYDNPLLRIRSGTPAPLLGIFPSAVPQTNFVDGTMTGANCAAAPCWPGNRGSDLPGDIAIKDNWNSPYGDSIIIGLSTGIRKGGMGINWKHAFSKSLPTANNGKTLLAGINQSYQASYDTPRMIYRIMDPATLNWSPWDSTEFAVDNMAVSGSDSIATSAFGAPNFRMTWPPFDKVGQNLPGGFTIKGKTAYADLKFLPRGTRVQYYFKATDINGGVAYQFSTDNIPLEVEDLPQLPGSANVAPDINEFDILPRVYASGSGTSLLNGVTTATVLNLDGSYSSWDFQQDPVTAALRGMGVRADRYRLTQGLDNADNFGGRELTGPPDNQRPRRQSNYFPNLTEYGIKDSLAKWYRIMIQSAHDRTATLEDESDARLLEEWWATDTGSNGGDRCFFVSGDDYFNAIDNTPAGEPSARRSSYSQNMLGVNSTAGAWNGTNSTSNPVGAYPTIEDRFSNPGSGPNLVAGYTYPVDGGCPGPNRFDALTKVGAATAQNVAFYPLFAGVNDVGAVANMVERDPVTDNDRNKAIGYGFSIQFVRKAGIPTSASNYVRSGVQERMQILYKFLTSCRGPRSGAPGDTAKCWPCPTDANMTGNWAVLTGFQTGTYGPLYKIQDNLAATGVEISDASGAPKVNRLEGNFPNPFNPQTTIKFTAAQAGRVTLRIFNVGGQLIRTLSTKAEVGANEVRWNGKRDDGASVASGLYFYKVKFADGTETGSRMALVK